MPCWTSLYSITFISFVKYIICHYVCIICAVIEQTTTSLDNSGEGCYNKFHILFRRKI